MGADFNIKPVGAPVATTIIKPEPEPVRQAVPTELPADKTVSVAGAPQQPALSTSNYQQADAERVSHEVIIDRDASAVVYLSIDKKTDLVVDQFPEESQLRTRAYLRALDTAKLDRQPATDRRA